MNKNIIALAVAAGFSAPMVATAAPTFYGAMQMELASVENCAAGICVDATLTDDQKRGRLGVKGSEDLGGGLKAIYKFEWQIDTSDADDTDGDREAMIGIKGDFGTFSAGTLKSAYKYAGGVKYDPFVATFLEARSRGGMSGKITDDGGPASGAFGHHGFLTDNIGYSNKVGNLHFAITTSLDETGGGKGRDGDLTASVKFKQKNWEAFVATASDDAHFAGFGDTTGADEYEATKVGGQWKSGPHKISAQLEKTELSYVGGSDKADVTFIGYQFKMGKNIFVAQLGKTDFDGFQAEIDYNAFGVIHKFSKKTRIFAGISQSELDVGGGLTVENNATSLGMRIDF